jgi:hypothetical protein
VLILPPGHAEAVRVRRRLPTRERWLIGGVLGAVAVVAVVLAVSLGTAGPSSANGCVHATVAGPVGAVQINQCGAAAQSICATVYAPGAYPPTGVRTLADECRKAGLPVSR